MKNLLLFLGIMLSFCTTSFGQIMYDQNDADYWASECSGAGSGASTAYFDAVALRTANFSKRTKAAFWNADVHAEQNAPVALEVAGDNAVANSLTKYNEGNTAFNEAEGYYNNAAADSLAAQTAYNNENWDLAVSKYRDAIDKYNSATGFVTAAQLFTESSEIADTYTDSVHDYVYGMDVTFQNDYTTTLLNTNENSIDSTQDYISEDCGIIISQYLAAFGSDAYYMNTIAPTIANAQAKLNEAKDMHQDALQLRVNLLLKINAGYAFLNADPSTPGKGIDEYQEGLSIMEDYDQLNEDVESEIGDAYFTACMLMADIQSRLP